MTELIIVSLILISIVIIYIKEKSIEKNKIPFHQRLKKESNNEWYW